MKTPLLETQTKDIGFQRQTKPYTLDDRQDFKNDGRAEKTQNKKPCQIQRAKQNYSQKMQRDKKKLAGEKML